MVDGVALGVLGTTATPVPAAGGAAAAGVVAAGAVPLG
jgi:hypothetical protein